MNNIIEKTFSDMTGMIISYITTKRILSSSDSIKSMMEHANPERELKRNTSTFYKAGNLDDMEEIQARLLVLSGIVNTQYRGISDLISEYKAEEAEKLRIYNEEQERLREQMASVIDALSPYFDNLEIEKGDILGFIKSGSEGIVVDMLPSIGYKVGIGKTVEVSKGVPGLSSSVYKMKARLVKDTTSAD